MVQLFFQAFFLQSYSWKNEKRAVYSNSTFFIENSRAFTGVVLVEYDKWWIEYSKNPFSYPAVLPAYECNLP